MNKYKINLIYKKDSLNLNDVIIRTLVNEIKIFSTKNHFAKSCSCTYLSLEKGAKD